MELISLPNPLRILMGSLGAWWLAQVLNPGFNPIAIMLLFLFPILVKELYFFFPNPEAEKPTEESVDDNSARENTA